MNATRKGSDRPLWHLACRRGWRQAIRGAFATVDRNRRREPEPKPIVPAARVRPWLVRARDVEDAVRGTNVVRDARRVRV